MASLEAFEGSELCALSDAIVVPGKGAPPQRDRSLSILVQNVERFFIGPRAAKDREFKAAY